MKEFSELLGTYHINSVEFRVYGCYDSATPEKEYDFYDVYAPSRTDDSQICINEGNPFYEFPSRCDVMILVDDYGYFKK